MPEMHIVREQRLASDSVRARDYPVIRSIHRFRSLLRPDRRTVTQLRDCIVRAGIVVILVIIILIAGVARPRLIAHVFPHYRWRTIVPRLVHIQIGGQLRPQLSQNLFSRERIPEAYKS